MSRSWALLFGGLKKHSRSPLHFVLQKYLARQLKRTPTSNMPEHNQPHPIPWRGFQFRSFIMSQRQLQQAFFLLVVMPFYITLAYCIMTKPIHSSLFQLTRVTAVGSAMLMASFRHIVDSRTLISQPLLPDVKANTAHRHPCHLHTIFEFMRTKDLLSPPPDTLICAHSTFSRISLRIHPPYCQEGQMMPCQRNPPTLLLWWSFYEKFSSNKLMNILKAWIHLLILQLTLHLIICQLFRRANHLITSSGMVFLCRTNR